jgi:hypothetical protein
MHINSRGYLSIFIPIIIFFIFLTSCGQKQPGCPFCTTDLQQASVLPLPANPLKALQIKWVALSGAPSILDPSTVCENDFKDVLFRRHIRASGCIWTPQCKIILRSVFGPEPNYGIINDPDLSIGEPGDVVINADLGLSDEMFNLVNAADAHWNAQPTGITAIAIRRFIWSDGKPSSVKGYATPNGGTRPFLFIVDPEFLPATFHDVHVSTEQMLSHELGHALGLCHSDKAGCNQVDANQQIGNLMLSDGNANHRVLTSNQCDIARNKYPQVFINGREHVLISSTMDSLDNNLINKNMRYLDLHKIVVYDGSPHKGNLKFILGTNGLFQGNKTAYWLVLNIDNNESTGLRVTELITFHRISW